MDFDCSDILNMFLDNVVRAEERKHPPRPFTVKDKLSDVFVTDVCAWHCYCPRTIYYNKVAGRPVTPKALLRFGIGHAIHEIAINENGNEISFFYKGFKSRMDDIDMEKGWIADKKTASSMPIGAGKYPTMQLNMYKVIAEENEEKPFKVNRLFVLYIDITNGNAQAFDVPMWEAKETKDMMFNTRNEILASVKERKPPSQRTGWWCESCQYIDLCKKNATEDDAPKAAPIAVQTHIDSEEVQSITTENGTKNYVFTLGKK